MKEKEKGNVSSRKEASFLLAKTLVSMSSCSARSVIQLYWLTHVLLDVKAANSLITEATNCQIANLSKHSVLGLRKPRGP